MARGDKIKCHTVQRQMGFTLKIYKKAMIEKTEKGRLEKRITKNAFIVQA